MVKYPKILIAAPTSVHKEYCFEEWFANTKELTYPNADIMLVDNSEDKEYCKLLNERGVKTRYVNYKNKPLLQRICESMEEIRKYAIGASYDYIFFKETDNICQADIIERLLFHNKQVTAGMYDIGHGLNRELCILLIDKDDHHQVPYKIGDEAATFVDGSLKKCFNAGFGTTLIHRSIFTKIPFRNIFNNDSYVDLLFADDLSKRNLDFWVDTSIMSSHLNIDWKKEGITV